MDVLPLLLLVILIASEGISFNAHFEHLFHHLRQMSTHVAFVGLLLVIFGLKNMTYFWAIVARLEE